MHKKVFVIFAGILTLIILGALFFTKIFSALGFLIAGIGNILRIVFSNPAGLTDIILRLWSLFLYGVGFNKWHHPWGTVYDSETKEPIHGVVVFLMDVDNNVVAKSITDVDGRYGFLVDSGFYHITVKKDGYIFPSSKLFGKGFDEVYNNLYFGNFIEIKNAGEVISKNIPMYHKDFNWSDFAKSEQHKFHFYHSGDRALGQIINVAFVVGFLTSLFNLLTQEIKIYNILLFVIYIAVFILNRRQFGKNIEGSVFFKDKNLPVAYGLLRVYSEDGVEVLHKVISRIGKYYCLLPNGIYKVSIEQKNADSSYTKIYEENKVEVKRGYLSQDFIV